MPYDHPVSCYDQNLLAVCGFNNALSLCTQQSQGTDTYPRARVSAPAAAWWRENIEAALLLCVGSRVPEARRSLCDRSWLMRLMPISWSATFRCQKVSLRRLSNYHHPICRRFCFCHGRLLLRQLDFSFLECKYAITSLLWLPLSSGAYNVVSTVHFLMN